MFGPRKIIRLMLVASTAGAVLLGGMPPASAGKSSGSSTTCSRRSPCQTADTAAPSVAVSTPAAGTTASGTVSFAGSSADNVAVSKVEVQVDGGAYALASGTTSWSKAVDTRTLTNGVHGFGVRAIDAAGNAGFTSVSLTVFNPATDSTAPAIAFAAPVAGATVSGTTTVTGSASDNGSIATVDVQVDGGAYALASGTGSWSADVDTSTYGDGAHTITARATDAAGNVKSAIVSVTFANAAIAGDTLVTDPAASNNLSPIGRTRMAQWGSLTGVIYSEQATNRKVVFFRNATTGATSTVSLPVDTLYGWSDVATVMTSANDLWVLGGTGPLYARHYALDGSPSSATLVSTEAFGNSDTRPGDLLALASGALVAVTHQQGATSPEAIQVAYRRPGGPWTALPSITDMGSMASKQVLAQHPDDGAVWMFNSTDAFGTIGAARFVEANGTLTMTMSDARFISQAKHGLNSSDPENPFLAVAVDPSTNALRLAYQSAEREVFTSGSEAMAGSRIAVASIAGDGSVSFASRAPVWAERVMPVGLVVEGGELVVSFLPVDASTLTADVVQVIRTTGGQWGTPTTFGTKHSQTYRVTYAAGRAEFATRLADGTIHLRSF